MHETAFVRAADVGIAALVAAVFAGVVGRIDVDAAQGGHAARRGSRVEQVPWLPKREGCAHRQIRGTRTDWAGACAGGVIASAAHRDQPATDGDRKHAVVADVGDGVGEISRAQRLRVAQLGHDQQHQNQASLP